MNRDDERTLLAIVGCWVLLGILLLPMIERIVQ